MTYIAFKTVDQRDRFEAECSRLGYPVTDWWPRTDGVMSYDPAVPDGIPEDLANRAYHVAIHEIAPSDLPDQHPEFKYLRVRKQ